MNDELVLVEKDDEQIRVHPLALENHKQLGWKVVEEKESTAEADDDKAAKEAAKKAAKEAAKKAAKEAAKKAAKE